MRCRLVLGVQRCKPEFFKKALKCYYRQAIKPKLFKMKTQKITYRPYRLNAILIPVLLTLLCFSAMPFLALAQSSKRELIVQTKAESQDTKDCKELLQAVKEMDNSRVRELLDRVDPNCSYRGDGEARSPLVAAARNGDLLILKLLMDAGADVAFHAEGDEPPLMAAAANGHLEVARLLVEEGAAVNQKLQGEGTALLLASREGQLEMVNYLIAQGADVNAQVSGDGTPLINAVRSGHIEIVRVLLEKGADPKLASPGDENPMIHAQNSKEKAMLALLQKYDKGR